MLKSLRKNTKVIIWTVVVAFVLGGGYSMGDYFKDILFGAKKGALYAGNVFGKNISYQEFNRFQRAAELFTPSEKTLSAEAVRQTAWQGLIFSHEAKRRNIDVADDEVRKEILDLLDRYQIPRDNYESWLERGVRISPKEFEAQIREIIRIRKLMKQMETTLTDTAVTAEDARQEFLKAGNQLAVAVITFTDEKEAKTFREKIKKPEDWDKAVEPRKAEVQQTSLLSTAVLPMVLQIKPEEAEKLHEQEKGAVSEPLASGPKWVVLQVLDKASADPAVFDTDPETYVKAMRERKIENGLTDKSREILAQANLQDYNPAPSPLPA
jgi:parvulin-like peptidyl-prolyl isomerase